MDVNGALQSVKPVHALPRAFYIDDAVYDADLERVWHREWVLAGVSAAVRSEGDYERVRIGNYELMLVRGADGTLRALHNVCRHRGFQICEAATGSFKRRIVCPYHQWSYDLDGSLAKARSMPEDFDGSGFELAEAACVEIEGLVFVCVAPEPPPIDAFVATVAPYLAPYRLASAVVAHRTVTVEAGNWKLVMENNRECFHCRSAHTELMRSFPEAPLHSGNAPLEETAALDQLVSETEALGLPGAYRAAPDHAYRIMRMPFLPGVSSMTMTGAPAVQRRFGGLPADVELGDVLLYHYPSSWNHFQADHSLVFRLTPLSATETELTSYWLVPEGSTAGVDYDFTTLTEVWEATNAQDASLVARAQRGVQSPAYVPGPYSPTEEEGVIQFIDWYLSRMRTYVAP